VSQSSHSRSHAVIVVRVEAKPMGSLVRHVMTMPHRNGAFRIRVQEDRSLGRKEAVSSDQIGVGT
jgi:hypothetical protein